MKIAVDAHGGDFGIAPNIEGSLEAVRLLGVDIVLVGNSAQISVELKKFPHADKSKISIVHCDKVADMGAEAVLECRDKPDSTIMVCSDLVGKKQADALVSAGNSGATMVAAFLKIGRIKGISRPAIAVPIPSVKGDIVLVDGGANTECKAHHLLHFALMGSVYARLLQGQSNPSVGILSVGEEETKGNSLVKETIPLLKQSGLNFYGPVEGRDVPMGTVSVVVCDGFVGNIALKISEGLAKAMFELIKAEINKSFICKIGAMLAKPAFKKVKDLTNPDVRGGAPLLGVNGVAVICHGRSNSTAVFNAIRVAFELVKLDAINEIKLGLEKINNNSVIEENEAVA